MTRIIGSIELELNDVAKLPRGDAAAVEPVPEAMGFEDVAGPAVEVVAVVVSVCVGT
jgi:hypothetical protein